MLSRHHTHCCLTYLLVHAVPTSNSFPVFVPQDCLVSQMKAVSPHLFLLTSIYIFIIGRIASLVVVFAMALFSNMSRRCFSLFVFFFIRAPDFCQRIICTKAMTNNSHSPKFETLHRSSPCILTCFSF